MPIKGASRITGAVYVQGTRDPKRALLRRADTERDTAYSAGVGKKRWRSALFEPKPITLPRLAFLEKPIEGDE